MDPLSLGMTGILALLVLLAFGVPIAFALGAIGVLGVAALKGWAVAESVLATIPFSATASWVYVVLPLFILMGHLSFAAGVTGEAYDFLAKWLQPVRGGLAIATIFGAAAFGATSGSSIATCGALGKVALPELRRHRYDIGLILGSIGASSSLAIMIPPSAVLIIYGMITEQSIGQLLLAGIFPGLLHALILSLGVWVMVWKNPSLAPKAGAVSWKEKLTSLLHVFPVLFLFFVVLGGIYLGVFTPTEAGAFGVLGALLLLAFRSRQRFKDIIAGLSQAAETTCMVFLIMIGAAVFSFFLTLTGIPVALSNSLAGLDLPPLAKLIVLLLPYLPLGMFLDPVSIMLLTLPIIFPVVIDLGFSGIWFGILITVFIELSLITPPVGFNVFVLGQLVPEMPILDVFRPHYPFILFTLVFLGIIIALPDIVLFLPNTMIVK